MTENKMEQIVVSDRDQGLVNLTEYFLQNSDFLYRICRRYLKNAEDAEDLVQMSYLRCVENIAQYTAGASLKAWMARVTINLCLNKYKEEKARKNRERKASSLTKDSMMDKSVEHLESSESLKKLIMNTVESLPDKYRMAIWLIYYEGLSFSEASIVLEVSEKTIRTQVSRGLEKVRNIVGKLQVALSAEAMILLMHETNLESISVAAIQKIKDSFTDFTTREISASTESTKLTAKVATTSSSWGIPAVLFVTLTTLTAGVYFFVVPPEKNVEKQTVTQESLKDVLPVESKELTHRIWDMAIPQDREFSILDGEWNWDETLKVMKTKTNEQTFLRLPIEQKKATDIHELVITVKSMGEPKINMFWLEGEEIPQRELLVNKPHQVSPTLRFYYFDHKIAFVVKNKIVYMSAYADSSQKRSMVLMSCDYGVQKVEYQKLDKIPEFLKGELENVSPEKSISLPPIPFTNANH